MTFKLNDKKYKTVSSRAGCEGCAAEFNAIKCVAIGDYIAEKPIKGCTGTNIIYKEVKC